MAKQRFGGIFIGGLKASDVIADRRHYEISETTIEDASFDRRLQSDAQLYNAVVSG
jgi:hypothetical protein